MNEKNKQLYEVSCIPHGYIGTVAQAHLGIALFTAHQQEREIPVNCREAVIKPILKKEYVHKRPIEARKAIPSIA